MTEITSTPSISHGGGGKAEGGRARMKGPIRWAVLGLTLLGLFLLLDTVFFLGVGVGISKSPVFVLYAEVGIFTAVAYLLFPAAKGSSARWYDIVLSAVTLMTFLYLGFASYQSTVAYKWVWTNAPALPTAASVAAVVVVMEATRRCAGLSLMIVAGLFGAYPLFAQWMPGPLNGTSFGLLDTIRFHVLDLQSIVGIAVNTIVYTVLGFMFFAAALTAMGAGQFFIDLSFSLLGHYRGGPAYVSILSSAAVGSMTGSPTTNILVTGAFTIPAMKKAGYKPSFAASVEAVASHGGVIMPPVMGTVAFLMASFLSIPYSEVILRAAIPAVLYYVAVFVAVNMRAASDKLTGVPKSELPSAIKTLRRGWVYIFVIAALVYFIFYLRVLGQAPFYALATLFVVSFFRKETRPNIKMMREVLDSAARMFAQIIVLIASVGLIIGSFSVTGVGNSLAREIVMLAHGNSALLLIVAGVAAFILGTGIPTLPVYIFLVIVLVPSLAATGFVPFAVHLFIIYLSLFSAFTPPVALAAYVAGTLANARFIDTCKDCVKIAATTYLLPYVFVLDPGILLFNATLPGVISTVLFFCIAIVFVHGAIDGYLYYFEHIRAWQRLLSLLAGLLLILPIALSHYAGLVVAVALVGASLLAKSRTTRRLRSA